MKLNLLKTLENTNGRISQTFLAKCLGRTPVTINRWVGGSHIPMGAERRLIEILEKNEVKLIYDEDIK